MSPFSKRIPSLFRPVFFKIFLFSIAISGNAACNKAPADMVRIPAGEFLMGTDEVDRDNLGIEFGLPTPFFEDEHPLHRVHLPAFFIDRFEVTNKQYKKFVKAVNRRPPDNWTEDSYPPESENFPVTFVNWFDANDYCRWMGKRLPTEEEWEKAARGTNGARYPWGNLFSPEHAHIAGGSVMFGSPSEVGRYESGKSPFGVYDMIGNVWEWTHSWYLPYEGNKLEKREFGQVFRVTRGLSFMSVGHYGQETYRKAAEVIARVSFRSFDDPSSRLADVGFRCARAS